MGPNHLNKLTSHKQQEIKYGATQKLSSAEDTRPALDASGIKVIQSIIGALLYYARAVDNKLVVALSAIVYQQAVSTEDTAKAIKHLLDYVAAYPNNGIIYHSINMILADHYGAGFHNESKGRIRAGAHIFLSENDPEPRCNGSVLTIAKIIKFGMTSAAEAELGAIFITAK